MSGFNYRSFGDMAQCIRKNISKIPFDFDRIVGIPRSGIIPAYMIALFLNKKACSLDELIQNTVLSSGYSREVDSQKKIKKVLIVDDSVHSGVAISKTKEKIAQCPHLKNIEIKYLAIYAREQAIGLVDYYFEIVPVPRLFQWNYLNMNVNERSCFDIDGVLCVDPAPEDNDDGERYRNFILNARPLYIPKYKIKALVTSRLEKYRKETEEWLQKNHVQYEKLYMLDLPNKEARIRLAAHSTFKAKIYAQTNAELFVESEPKQAEEIAKLTGKPCICVGNDKYYEGDGRCKVELFDLKDYVRKDKRKRILLYSHEFTYTGAPHSLLRICKVLRNNYYLEVWGPETGEFEIEFRKLGIKVAIVPYSVCAIDNVKKAIESFDFCIVNTVIANRFFDIASSLIPTVWYIREATNIPDICRGNKAREQSLRRATDLYCVSEYAQQYIAKTYNPRVKVLRNCMEDYSDQVKKKTDHAVINFLQLGTITERKGFTEYVEAFRRIPLELRSKAHLYFAGRLIQSRSAYWEPLLEGIKNDEDITYLGEILGLEEKIKVFNNIDVFVVASYDESCSLVVLEGAMLSKPLIVTENVGAKYMVSQENGFIVKTRDIDELSAAMTYMIKNANRLEEMGSFSRKKYESLASMEIYSKAINGLAERYVKKSKFKWKIKKRIYKIIYNSLGYKFIKSLRANGVKVTLQKTKNYFARTKAYNYQHLKKNTVPILLWGTSASKIAVDQSYNAKIDNWFGKVSIRAMNQEPFDGELTLETDIKDSQNIILDVKKCILEYFSGNNDKYFMIDLLDEKFELVRFNGKYVITKSDLLMRNLGEIYINGMPISKKQLLKYSPTENQIIESVRFFAASIKRFFSVDKIIVNEAYFAEQYVGKDGILHDFPENKKAQFHNKNILLKKLYHVLKEELEGCHIISQKKYLADEKHPQGLSTMHYIPKCYQYIARKVDSILKQ